MNDVKTAYFFRFCPSVFLYLGSMVPGVWFLELDRVEKRILMRESNINNTENFDFTNVASEDSKHLEKAFGVGFDT